MENGEREQIMSPRVDFRRRGESDDKNGNMRSQFGQIDEEYWLNRITEKAKVPIDFWKGENPQKEKGAKST